MSGLSVELRELEAKLKAGFMNRERSAQLVEKQVMEQDRKVLYLYIPNSGALAAPKRSPPILI